MTTRPLPPSSPPQILHHHHHHPQLLLLLLVPLSSILLLLLLLIYLYHQYYRHRQTTTTVATTTSSIPHVPFHLLSSSFHPSLALGRGASSSVFLATLPDNPTTPVAVKLFHSHQRLSFLHELHLHSLLPRPSSPFVVPLLAHSSSTASHAHLHRHLLVFEYLPNRSLQDALFDPEHLLLLPWPLRLSILLDVAEALSYLHHHGIVHGDVKPSNILLSSDFRAKLSDFGLARLTTPNTHHVKEPIGTQICPLDDDTHQEEAKKMPEKKKKKRKKRKRKMREWWKEEPTPEQRKKQGRRLRENNVDVPEEEEVMPRGTVCYVAPEWSSPSMWGEKADVYSFGVLTLVVLSGRRPLHVVASPMKLEKANLVGWCRQLLATGGDLLEVVDERLHRADYDEVEVRTCLGLAVLCLQRVPYLRPRSSDVVKILKGEAPLPPLPPSLSPSPRRRRRSLPEVAESN